MAKVNRLKKEIKKNKRNSKINIPILILSFLLVIITATIGSSVTVIDEWYDSVRPSITPPSIAFPIVWTILFFMMGLSMYFAWTNTNKKKEKIKIFLLFGINYILNVLWSFLFFGIRKPIYAFYEIIVLWISILVMVIYLRKIDKKASWLLVPYLLWVSFASLLTGLVAFA
ncbi:MAG TPA: tryptophan-rich sensory protein [Candidatus Paceibacterota bacterium]|nr:tryptophan-rich sensory protein [Candidatus Paceibacterota bacterium]